MQARAKSDDVDRSTHDGSIDSRERHRHPDAAACRAHRLSAEGAMPTYATSTVAAPMPNIENLRKQAKLILRWHRDRYYPVAAQIRSGLPRFSRMTDPEILSHGFKLSDAQEVVARQHGFESWQALKEGLSTMLDHAGANSPRAVITAAEPQLFVADIGASCDFFTGKLGFTVVFTYGEPPFYAQVARDAARINLRCVAKPRSIPNCATAKSCSPLRSRSRPRKRSNNSSSRISRWASPSSGR
jgi:hypothetical protein